KADRARRHYAIAEWLAGAARETDREDEYLEQLPPPCGAAAELSQELGHIEGLADDICDLALKSIERAAVRARQRDTHLVSVRLLDRALRLLPPEPSVVQRRVLLERARAKAQLHEMAEARADVDAVMAQ